jgi:predicted dienelactone hydrolase
MSNEFAAHIVSYGYVVVSVNGQDSYEVLGSKLIDYPQEILAALNIAADDPPVELSGVMDTDNAGVFGYSFDGYNALAMSGAKFDPQYHRQQCEDIETLLEKTNPKPIGFWKDYMCPKDKDFVEIVGDAGSRLTVGEDGLWQAMTDPRIKAAAPLAPKGMLLFGERGLKEVKMPILIMDGTSDDICPYGIESVAIYANIGSQEKTLISFIGEGHMMVFDQNIRSKMQTFLVAFFNHHLKGNSDDAYNYSAEFVNQQPGLKWGVVTD